MIRCALLVWALLLGAVVRADGGALQMVGQARLNVLFWPVYDSRLYSPDGRYAEGARPLRLEIQYLRDVEAQLGMARRGREEQPQRQQSRQEAVSIKAREHHLHCNPYSVGLNTISRRRSNARGSRAAGSGEAR